MLQRLVIALSLVKTCKSYEKLPNEIRQIYFLYQEKEISKKIYNNIMNSVKV